MRRLARLVLLGLAAFPVWAQFDRAIEPRPFTFPQDHGDHPRFHTEWWYLTGWLYDADERLYGYQLTFFRTAFGRRDAGAPARSSPLAAGDLILYHGALTDVAGQRVYHAQDLSRRALNWAGADSTGLGVYLFDQSLKARPDGVWEARFAVDGHTLRLELDQEDPPVLHGQVPGLSRKGAQPGQASYYYSLPRLRTYGQLQVAATGQVRPVRGQSWFDHEFGSNQLDPQQAGWDWFSVALDDGSALMVYLLRRQDGSLEAASSGTLVTPDGQVRHLPQQAIRLEATARWQSPHTEAVYPAAWSLSVPAAALHLDIRPLVADQEQDARATTGIVYWEGLCDFKGTRANFPVAGLGYVELVGYETPVADRF